MTDAVEVQPGPTGDEVPATATRSPAMTSPWLLGAPPPRSMKRDRSFFSRAWMSSGLHCDSEDASHLKEKGNIIITAASLKKKKIYISGSISNRTRLSNIVMMFDTLV